MKIKLFDMIFKNNKRLELKNLFLSSRKPKTVPLLSNCKHYNTCFNKWDIFFYEWSDVTRTPLAFHSLKEFTEFLNKSGITLSTLDRTKLNFYRTNYVACYKNTNTLNIRWSYELLKTTMV